MSARARFVPGNPHAWSPINERDTPHYQSSTYNKCIDATIGSPHFVGLLALPPCTTGIQPASPWSFHHPRRVPSSIPSSIPSADSGVHRRHYRYRSRYYATHWTLLRFPVRSRRRAIGQSHHHHLMRMRQVHSERAPHTVDLPTCAADAPSTRHTFPRPSYRHAWRGASRNCFPVPRSPPSDPGSHLHRAHAPGGAGQTGCRERRAQTGAPATQIPLGHRRYAAADIACLRRRPCGQRHAGDPPACSDGPCR